MISTHFRRTPTMTRAGAGAVVGSGLEVRLGMILEDMGTPIHFPTTSARNEAGIQPRRRSRSRRRVAEYVGEDMGSRNHFHITSPRTKGGIRSPVAGRGWGWGREDVGGVGELDEPPSELRLIPVHLLSNFDLD